MKILVIGSGGREHAICEQFKKSPKVLEIFALSGNAGISEIAKIVENVAISNHQEVIDFCQKNKIDLVFIGPEQPLVDGLVDDLQKNNIKVFGPSKKASQLEGSKVFMKNIAKKYNVPTAKYQTFSDKLEAIKFAKEIGFPCVIKTDGLASGKGVIIAQTIFEATQVIDEVLNGKFGDAGKNIIIEEFLTGFEASYFIICDGKNFKSLGFAHDYKKVGENDAGLNTGGMGTYSPSKKVSKNLEEKIIKTIIEPTILGLKQENCEFVGILFAGLMINEKSEAKLLEYNIRFGDPETQVILPRLKTDFVDLILSATNQELDKINIEFDENKHAVCVVMASKGYPESYKKNGKINLEEAKKVKNTKIFHAGTKLENGEILANGGRVLNIVGFGENIEIARENAYKAVEKVDWADGFCRFDIAKI